MWKIDNICFADLAILDVILYRVSHDLSVYGHHITYSRVWINRIRLPSSLWLAEQQKNNFSLTPFASQGLVSRDRGSAVPSRVSLFIFSTSFTLNVWYLLARFLDVPAAESIYYTVNRHRASLEVFGVRCSGRAIAYRWCSLPRIRRHRVSSAETPSTTTAPLYYLTKLHTAVYFRWY